LLTAIRTVAAGDALLAPGVTRGLIAEIVAPATAIAATAVAGVLCGSAATLRWARTSEALPDHRPGGEPAEP
jgi:hypothetical protein